MDLYYKKDIDNLDKELELKPDETFTIGIKDNETYFDGYADVYDGQVIVFNKKTNEHNEYDCIITHEALCYSFYGED